MWYFNGQIINTPKTIQIGDLRYSKEIFHDPDQQTELGIKPYREIRPDDRYFWTGTYSVDESGDEVVGTYAAIGKDTDVLTKNMLSSIKSQLSNKLTEIDWYWMRKLRIGTEVPSDIQEYAETLYSEYDTKKSEISAMNKISQIEEYENRPYTTVMKVKSYNSDGKSIYGPETTSHTTSINMCNHWTSNPNNDVAPEFVSLTAN